MKVTFEHLLKSDVKHFYDNMDIKLLTRKYAVFVSYLLNPDVDCQLRDIEEVHSNIFKMNKHGKKKGKCPIKIKEKNFDIWM